MTTLTGSVRSDDVGFIGRAIADALSRAGHVVYAQSRSADKANEFARAELVPFIYEPGQQTEKLASLAKDLDVGT